MTRLGYQIPNFTYPGVESAGIFDIVAAQAKEADRSGFDTVMLMDHFYQLPMLGDPDANMLECYTTLGALARETSKVRLGALVTGNTYRNPTLLAKIITALDVVSGGRAQLGIGAGWFEFEHDSLGYEFNTFTERFEKLEEALQIILPMLRDERPTLDGKYYKVTDAINHPAPISRIPVMIGGSGEKKTLRMVAQYADESNMTSAPEELPHKLEVLAAHCAAVGRDRSEITVSQANNVVLAPTHEQAFEEFADALAMRNIDLRNGDPEFRTMIEGMVILGDPDEVGERLAAIVALGADGITVSAPANGFIPERVELLGQVATKALA
ncbi:MAG: LLM class F420-dependent oxidoreductase [Acidimicrobiia bacterium]